MSAVFFKGGAMFKAKADTRNNRLYITLAGIIQKAEAAKAAEAVIDASRQLMADFDVITDLTELKPASPEVEAQLKKVQKYLKTHGVRRVVRVVSEEETIGARQLRRVGLSVGYLGESVKTVAEAEKLLNEN
jgi:hypothetical protein